MGVMKGVIAKINPQLGVIDLTHQIPPQNLAAGRFCLMAACSYFPAGTVFLAVVDPGVGSQRRGVAVQFARGYLVGPDNGLLSGVLNLFPGIAAVTLTNPDYWLSPHPSTTFHGRDIFAPVAAYLASGVPWQVLGNPIDPQSLVQLPIPSMEVTGEGILGCIQYVDGFGNLITNIPGTEVEGKNWWLKIAGTVIARGQTYSDVQLGEMVGLIGSHGWVEIAVNQGNAQSQLQVAWGDRVLVCQGEIDG